MQLILNDIGKRFRYEWVFRHLNYTFESGQSYAILGANGAGKSTLLQIIAGSMQPSEGRVTLQDKDGKSIADELQYAQLSWAAPYIDLIDEFTLTEAIEFQRRFKPLLPDFDTPKLIEYLQLEASRHKSLRYFSSGMKQRVKLGLALLSQTPIVLLDEPTMNLDAAATQWYLQTVARYAQHRLFIIASNQAHEYENCQHHIYVGKASATNKS